MSFETEATLSLTVPKTQLTQIRSDIESELSDIGLAATDGSSMSVQASQTNSNTRGRGGRRLIRLNQSRNEYLSDSLLYLEDIEDHLSESGFGGGGLAAEVLGIGGDFAAEGAGAAADTVSGLATDVAGTAIGQAAGSVIADQISGSTVSLEPTPVPVEGDGSSGNSITVSPTLKPTFRPTFEPTVDVSPELDLPDFNFGGGGGAGPVRVDESQLPLPVRRDPLPVEDIEPLPVEDVGPITVVVGGGSKGSRPNSSGDGRNIAEKFTDAFGNIPIIGPPAEEFSENVGRRSRELTPFVSTQESGGESTGGRGNLSVDVTHSPTYNMEVDPRQLNQLADRIVSELESRVERDIDEIRDDLDEVEGDIAELERDVRSGSGVR